MSSGIAIIAFIVGIFGFMPASASVAPCEIHVWPTTTLKAATQGSGMSGLMPALMQGNTDAQIATLGALLDPAGQIEQVEKTDLRAAFGLAPDTIVVFHDAVDDRAWKSRARNSDSQAACYYEFRIDSIVFNRHPIYGKDILSFFDFRNFDAHGKITMSSSDRVRTKMAASPRRSKAIPRASPRQPTW